MKKIVLGLSGGMDSATLCGYYLNQGCKVYPVCFKYGSKHNRYERAAADRIASTYNLKLQEVDVSFMDSFSSNLLMSGGDIPEGNYTDESMKLTVVPGRNLIFASIMMGIAWSRGADVIALGVHAGDHAIYPDCREMFIAALNASVIAGSDGRVRVEAPFLNLDKAGILEIGYGLKRPVPYQITRTCYKDQLNACGKCGSCTERLEAFFKIGFMDPIEYEEERKDV